MASTRLISGGRDNVRRGGGHWVMVVQRIVLISRGDNTSLRRCLPPGATR